MPNKETPYYLYVNKKQDQYGPFTINYIMNLLKNKNISEDDYIWVENDWQLLKEFLSKNKKISENENYLPENFEIPENLKLTGSKVYYKGYIKGVSDRFYKRLQMKIPAEISLKNSNTFYPADVEDISVGGTSINTIDLIAKKDDVVIIKFFIASLFKYINVEGKVIRVKHLYTNHNNYAIKFSDMSKEEGKILIDRLSWKAEYY